MAQAKDQDQKESRLVRRIKRELMRRITDGTYAPHAYIPSQRKLARELGTSRLTVSAALAALAREGLVVRNPGRGTRVLPAMDRLPRPLVGIIYASPQPYRRQPVGTLSTIDGAVAALNRLHCRHEILAATPRCALDADEPFTRFGALLFVEGFGLPEEVIETELTRRPLPLVVAKLESDYKLDFSATWVDHREPVLQAVRTLANMGHKRIGFVTREPTYAFYGKARDGYLSGLREAGLPLDESLISETDHTAALSGYFAAKKLLNASTGRPTAIVAGRDTLAEGTCRAIEEAGLQVGHDVSVIGFDDQTWPQPPGDLFLTTFREPCYEMGVAAVEMLVERVVDETLPPERRRLETPFILRRSAGPPISNIVPTPKEPPEISPKAQASREPSA